MVRITRLDLAEGQARSRRVVIWPRAPVWSRQDDGRLFVETDAASCKVKRIRRNPAGPCPTLRGPTAKTNSPLSVSEIMSHCVALPWDAESASLAPSAVCGS